MKYYIYIIFSISFLMACNRSKNDIPITTKVTAIKYEELQEKINQKDDRLYVLNFWATWCVPCVAELPDFMAVNNQLYHDKNYQMYLVTLDQVKNINTLVLPFIKSNKLTAPVFLLDDNSRMDEWINAIHTNWSGAIPATAMYKNGEQVFFIEGKMTKEELLQTIKKYK